jgi:exodeoxyribonuclease-3
VRITTWNVNGLRAVLGKGALAWVESASPEILCLQEIKARPEQLNEAQRGFWGAGQSLWNPAERLGYSGVATFSRQPAQTHSMGLGLPEFDSEGRVLATFQDGFWLYNIYFPNGQRGQDRVDYKLRFYARLLEQCERLHAAGEKIVICGDFNTAHHEIDLANPKSNETTSGFLPEERVWIDHYLARGFVDAFRALYPQKVQYTWWTYITNARKRNVGWRLDYFLISEGLMPRVRDVVIHDDIFGSDHCPVSLILDA